MTKLGYRIRRLFIENVKRVRIVEVIPKGDVIEIAGQNGQGKSSILDSIIYVLGGQGEIPIEPIRKGEKSAKIVLETDEFTAIRSWTANDKTYLTVAANTGKSPQAFLDSKVNKISFDPVAFMRMKPKEQEALLRQVTGLSTVDLEQERARIYEARKTVGYDVKRLEVFRKELGEPVYGLPDEEESAQDLLNRINSISEVTEKRSKLISKIAMARGDIANSDEKIKIKMEQIRQLQKEVDAIEKVKIVNIQRMDAMQKDLDDITVEDITPLRGELKIIEEKNKTIRMNQQINTVQNQLGDVQTQYSSHTHEIEDIDKQIQDRIRTANFPIEGLSINDDGIVFNEIPLIQASQAEQVKIALAIAESLNPELQIILIKDGSLLDKKSMGAIRSFAKEKNCQIWVERVEPDSADAIIIEDGGIVRS